MKTKLLLVIPLLLLFAVATPTHAQSFPGGTVNIYNDYSCSGSGVVGPVGYPDEETPNHQAVLDSTIAYEFNNPNDFNYAPFYSNPQLYCVGRDIHWTGNPAISAWAITVRIYSGTGMVYTPPTCTGSCGNNAGSRIYSAATYTLTPPLPDLTSTFGSPVTVAVNHAVTLTGTVTDTAGTGDATTTFPNMISVCTPGCAQRWDIQANSISSLAAGASAGISASFTPSVSGQLYYATCANYQITGPGTYANPMAESNYTNNCNFWQTLTVNPPGDLSADQPTAVTIPAGSAYTFTGTARNLSTTGTADMSTTSGFYSNFQVCDPASGGSQGNTVGNCVVSTGVQFLDNNASAPNGYWYSSTGTIGPGGTVPLSYTWTPPTVKTWTLEHELHQDLAKGTPEGYLAYAADLLKSSFIPSKAEAGNGSYQLAYRWCANNDVNWSKTLPSSNYSNECGGWNTMTVTTAAPTASCSVSPNPASSNSPVTWTAIASGGSPPYSYVWGGNVSGTGSSVSQSYSAAGTYTGTVTVTDSVGASSPATPCAAPLTVVNCTPTFNANPTTLVQGQQSTLTWNENPICASSCVGSGFNTGGALSSPGGGVQVTPTAPSTSYALTCSPQPAVNQTVNVNVPSVTLSANPNRVPSGGTTALTWTSTYTNNCSVTRNGGGTIGTGKTGTNVADPTPIIQQTTYTANCTTNGSPVSATTVVNILPQLQEF